MKAPQKRPHVVKRAAKEFSLKSFFEKFVSIEFSKKIFHFDATIALIVLVFSLAIMWKTENIESLPTLIMAVFGALAAGEAFYYNKAKKENEIKLMRENNIEVTKEDIETDDQSFFTEE